jgi:hypothetical protein
MAPLLEGMPEITR